jgi:hypothetical protein
MLALIVLFAISCKSTTYEAVYPTLSDGKYDSEFPYRNCSEQLEDIASTLVKLDVLVFYKTYSFTLESKVRNDQVQERDTYNDATATDVFSESVGGTAMTISYTGQNIAYLSCAHIVYYPDTVITYYPYPDDQYIQVIGIKARQQNNISMSPPGEDLQVLAIDRRSDIAILGKEVTGPMQAETPVFDYPMGDSRELEWGSFVYIMGYPLGHAMITRGIVSDPDRIRKGSFLIDAVFNQGFSGGPVIAVRDGVPNFEIVGMVKSSAAVNKYYLSPNNTEELGNMSMGEAYNGEMKITSEKEIQYGVTFSVTTETLREFYGKHRKELEGKGYTLDVFFGMNSN